MLQSCFPCRNVLCRLSANVLGTKDMPLQTQHSLFLLEFSGSLKELVLGRYVDGFRKILPFLQLIFFLYLCRHSHAKCNHCVPQLSGSSVRSGYPILTATSTENLSVPVTSQETVQASTQTFLGFRNAFHPYLRTCVWEARNGVLDVSDCVRLGKGCLHYCFGCCHVLCISSSKT